jgi:hypothetical protein
VADKSRVKAVAAKISAARELARRLAEEKQAAAAALKSEDKDAERLKRSTEEAAAQAAAQVGGSVCWIWVVGAGIAAPRRRWHRQQHRWGGSVLCVGPVGEVRWGRGIAA